MSGLWGTLGFRENPYFATPIALSEEGKELFVGRASEIRRVINKWSSSKDGGITVVGGHIGTGKTSFLNVCQFLCLTGVRDFELPFDPPLLIPSVERVQLENDQSERSFLVRVLRSTALSIQWTCAFLKEDLPTEVQELLSWTDSTIQASTTTKGGGLTLSIPGLPVGGGLTGQTATGVTTKKLDDMHVDALIDQLRKLADQATKVRDYLGVIVAIDNIEMIETEVLVKLLNKYRDTLFSIPHIWWVLIGQKGLYDLIAADAPRVAQRITGEETTLSGLSWGDFDLATQARISAFKTRDDAVGPVDETLLKLLFDASSGEIRFIFKIADQLVGDAIAEHPNATSVPPTMAEGLLRTSVSEQIKRLSLSGRESRVLKMLCERGSCRPKDYKEFGLQNAPNFIQGALQPLQEKGLVTKSTEGNAALYSPRPPAILANRFGFLGSLQPGPLQDELDSEPTPE